MYCCRIKMHRRQVSLFTREWIEIAFLSWQYAQSMSPSLRGSGLKSLPWELSTGGR